MKVKKGDFIAVDYEGSFEDGEIFDSSKHGDHSHPLEFTVGSGQVIKGFDDAAMGMAVGESKKFTVPAKDAYGEYDPEMTKAVPREALPKDHEPKVGMTLMVASPSGEQFPVTVSKVQGNQVTLDFNHPLAGKTLIFNITLLRIGADPNPPKPHKHH